MNIKYLGSKYGGWSVDLDSISDGDTIICGGVGEDITFEQELLKYKNVKIIEIDPTEKSHKFMEDKVDDNITLIKKAIEKEGIGYVRMYKNKNPNWVSESMSVSHDMVGDDYYDSPVVTIEELKNEYNPSFIKLDIEGSEYNVLEDCIGIKQVCVEFHHHCMSDKTIKDTELLINKFLINGYKIINSTNNYQEITFLK